MDEKSPHKYRVDHKNVSNFAIMLYCSTIEFKQKEITFLNSNHSWTAREIMTLAYTLLFWQWNTQNSIGCPKRTKWPIQHVSLHEIDIQSQRLAENMPNRASILLS